MARPPDWAPTDADLQNLRRANALDLVLFEWAAARMRRRLETHLLSPGHPWAGDVELPPINELGLGCQKC